MTSVTERTGTQRRGGEVSEALAGAVALARDAAAEVAGGSAVGEHEGIACEAENTATHYFGSRLRGYRGWQWACVLSEAEARVTIDEISLIPGPDALLAPEWVPWSERLHAGDVGPGDVLPVSDDDERLAPGYELIPGDEDEFAADLPIGLGRERVLSHYGRVAAAERWESGEHSPDTETAKTAEHHCGSCGFLVPLAGALGRMFGVCANEFSADAQVVHLEYGCGAHSSVRSEQAGPGQRAGTPFDDHAVDFESAPGEEPSREAAETLAQ